MKRIRSITIKVFKGIKKFFDNETPLASLFFYLCSFLIYILGKQIAALYMIGLAIWLRIEYNQNKKDKA